MIYLLPHLIEESAGKYPDHEAMRFNKTGLTYAGLVRRADNLARLLVDQGVKRRDRVGIYLNKSLESAVAIYGILKAGAAYVPLDPLAPPARLAYVVRDCGIRCLVAQEARLDALRQIAASAPGLECVVGVGSQPDLNLRAFTWEEVYSLPGGPASQVGAVEHDLAYIMYTSGSTGKPKGMMHTHYSGLSYAKMAAHTYSVTHADILSNHSPLHFDMSTFDYFSGPLAGATTVIIPEAYTKLPASLSRLIEDERMTIWYSVPFALIQLLLRGALPGRDLSSLRWVLFGGEPFPPGHLRDLMKLLPGARFSNVYGPAEVNQCTYYHVPPLPEDASEPVPIGRIWDGSEALVVGEDDRPVPPGEEGELLVRTPTMMRGYWGRPDLNERAFYRREVFENYEDVFYRTGDLVQLQPDGNYRFLGRKDRQIKTRGYRVELDEIENLLSSHPQVEENAVYALPDREGSHTIEAAVLLRVGARASEEDFRAYLVKLLPTYAVPARTHILQEFPRTTSGKIDRRALRDRALAAQEMAGEAA
jgi:amino acid adenylation domain-containing protein